MRLSVALPDGSTVSSMALSPDGRRLAIALVSDGKRQLWLRSLDSTELQLLPTTNPAQYLFWSPDGRFIGFLSNGALKMIAATGGPPQTVCERANGGGTWNRDGVILFGTEAGHIGRASTSGGACTALTVAGHGETHRFPEFLPDGRHFLYLAIGAAKGQNGVYVGSVDDPTRARRLEGNARYTWTGVPIQMTGGTPQIGEPTPLFTLTMSSLTPRQSWTTS